MLSYPQTSQTSVEHFSLQHEAVDPQRVNPRALNQVTNLHDLVLLREANDTVPQDGDPGVEIFGSADHIDVVDILKVQKDSGSLMLPPACLLHEVDEDGPAVGYGGSEVIHFFLSW